LWHAEYGSSDCCQEGKYPQPGFFQHWASGVFPKFAGRTDWTPCLASLWTVAILKFDANYDSFDLDRFYPKSVGDVKEFKRGMLLHSRNALIAEAWKFHTVLDTDHDGCLSQEEYDHFSFEQYPQSIYINFTTVKEFSAVEEYMQLPRYDYPAILGNGSCVDEVAWQMWGLEAILDSFSDSHANSNKSCKTQTPIQAEMDHDSMTLTLVMVLGCCGLVAIVSLSCLALYRCRNHQYRANLDKAKQVQKLLRAKIDAWSRFDASLCTKTCDLEPAFVHSLGLQGYQPETLDLINLAHGEDARVLEEMLAQLEQDLDSGSLPQMTKLRFVYGETGKAVTKSYGIAYVPVELLMAWGSETRSTILVGITILGEAPYARSLPRIGADDVPDVEALYEPREASLSELAPSELSQGEFILNGSDVISFGESEARTFRSMTATGHQGGHITKNFNDLKTSQIRDAFRQSKVTFESGPASFAESGRQQSKETSGSTAVSSRPDISSSSSSCEAISL